MEEVALMRTIRSRACFQPNRLRRVAGWDRRLHCVNDYLFTVSCRLSIAAENNSSYWLNFTETFDRTTYVCRLARSADSYFCSVQKPNHSGTFSESDMYRILLCRDDGPDACTLLDDDYAPVENIQPNAPCCLAVGRRSSRYHFTWNSTYEEHGRYTRLTDDLKYQLRLYNGSDTVIWHQVSTDETHFSMDEATLAGGVEYSARVRSSPGQWFYSGQWSEWSPEVRWIATNVGPPPKDLPRKAFLSELVKVLVPLSAAVLLVLLLCFAPVKKWREGVFIPTPAPYFDTLYGDCQGDFKSWVVAHQSPADLLKAEETLQIDTVTKCVEDRSHLRPRQVMEEHTYSNILVCDEALLGLPYAVSTMAPRSGSAGQPEWRLYVTLKTEDPWYCNEYCMLTGFQPSDSE